MIFLPTLNRVAELEKFFEAYRQTESIVPGWVVTDIDDYNDNSAGYNALQLPKGWEIKLTKSRSMGDKSRELFSELLEHPWVMILNDDHRPRTRHWDQIILSNLDGTNIVSTNDGPNPQSPWNANQRICGAITFSRQILEALGYLFPRELHHFFSDDVWAALANHCRNVVVLKDVCVEHEHAYNHPQKQDKTFKLINGENIIEELRTTGTGTGGYWKQDKETFEAWLKEDLVNDQRKLFQIMGKMGVMIATPAHDGNVSLEFAKGLADTQCAAMNSRLYFEFAEVQNSSLIAHARNSLVHMFLESRSQKLLFIDADQSFNHQILFALLGSPRRIIAGVTPHKRFPINLNFEPLTEHNGYFANLCHKSEGEFFKFIKERGDQRGEVEVNRSGTGCLMIDRSVFKIMEEYQTEKALILEEFKGLLKGDERFNKYQEIIEEKLVQNFWYKPFDSDPNTTHREYFWMGANDQQYRGEDWHFTALAKKLHMPIFINANCLLGHKGNWTFSIRPMIHIQQEEDQKLKAQMEIAKNEQQNAS